MIELRDVYKKLGSRQILSGMTLRVPKGMNFVLMGPSGSGKSVTLKHVIGILRPDAGSVTVDGQEVSTMDRTQLMTLRKRMGYLFQNGALINWLTVADNVALPLEEHSRLGKSELRDRVHEVLGLVDMDHAASQYPPSISGGMKLRTGLARALVTNPEYVLYDEPNAGLDPEISRSINETIRELKDRLHVTSIVVEHRVGCIQVVADDVIFLEAGKALVNLPVDEFFRSRHPRIVQFLGEKPD